jgi:hypothetical protein
MVKSKSITPGPTLKRACRLVGAIAATALYALSAHADEVDRFKPASPEPGTEIPQATIKFGMRPYADNTFYIIGMKKDWFKEVGISFDPAPYGIKANDSNVTTLLLNGQLDMISEYCPLMLPTYKQSPKLKCLASTDNFVGNAILANPKLKLRTFKDYLADGLSYEDAVKAALKPLEGKSLVTSPQLSHRAFTDYVKDLSKTNFTYQILDDSKSLVLAKSGREDFVNPEGAPIVYTLRQSGWTNVIDIGDILKNAKGGDSTIEGLVAIVGVGGNADYVNANQNTVLRFMSVVWRIIDAVHKDPSLYELQAPYLNSVAGTSLDGKTLKDTFDVLHPLTPYAQNAQYYTDKNASTYYASVWSGIIADFEKNSIIPKGVVTADDIMWGGPIWQQMEDYRAKASALIDQNKSKQLKDTDKKLLDQSVALFDKFDFLDSYRLAAAIQ